MVLLLERGGLGTNVSNIEQQGGFTENLANTQDPDSPAETFISEEGVINARGKVLGGSSSINAGFYSRAGLSYVREAGWDEALVNESYSWVEKDVVSRPVLKLWQGFFRSSLFEGGLRPYNGFTVDHVKGTKIEESAFDWHGRRCNSKDFLKHANINNLRIGLHATVNRILFYNGTTDLVMCQRDQGLMVWYIKIQMGLFTGLYYHKMEGTLLFHLVLGEW